MVTDLINNLKTLKSPESLQQIIGLYQVRFVCNRCDDEGRGCMVWGSRLNMLNQLDELHYSLIRLLKENRSKLAYLIIA